MKKSILFTAVMAVAVALLCVTCDDNGLGKSDKNDGDANRFIDKFHGGDKPIDSCVANPTAQRCPDYCPSTQPNCPGYVEPPCPSTQPNCPGYVEPPCPSTQPNCPGYVEPSCPSTQPNCPGYVEPSCPSTQPNCPGYIDPNPPPTIVYGTPVTYDGETYQTIVIGTQTWFASNLNYTTTNSKCYADASANCTKYGRLYNWNEAMEACPAEWRLPTDDDWDKLMGAVGGWETAGTKLKAKSDWNSNGNGADDYGFAALPGGYGHLAGVFSNTGKNGNWWSATATAGNANNAWSRSMNYDHENVSRNGNNKTYLFSVRCVKN